MGIPSVGQDLLRLPGQAHGHEAEKSHGRPGELPFPVGLNQSSKDPQSFMPTQDSAQLNGINFSYLYASVQMHLEQKITDETGKVLGQRTLDVNIVYERLRMKYSTQETPEQGTEGQGAPEQTEGDPKVEANPFLKKLLEYVSPEKTAGRILNFVTNGFKITSFGLEDTPGSRQEFVDFITPFIRSGVDQALGMFGDSLPEEAKTMAEKTFSLIEDGLKKFVDGPTQG